MTDNVELKPCAHCGSTATAMQNGKRWWIECDGCGMCTPADNFGDPRKCWNTRNDDTTRSGDVAAAQVEEDEESTEDLVALIHKVNAHPLMERLSEAMVLIATHHDSEVNEAWKVLHRLRKALRAHLESLREAQSRAEIGLNLLRQLVGGNNALRTLDVFACNQAEQCEAWAKGEAQGVREK